MNKLRFTKETEQKTTEYTCQRKDCGKTSYSLDAARYHEAWHGVAKSTVVCSGGIVSNLFLEKDDFLRYYLMVYSRPARELENIWAGPGYYIIHQNKVLAKNDFLKLIDDLLKF